MRKLALFVLGYAAAVACAVYILPAGLRLPLGVVSVVILLALGRLGGVMGRRLRIILLGICVALLWLCVFDYIWVRPATSLDDKTVELTATVVDWPEQTDYGWQVEVRTVVGKVVRVKVRLNCDEQGESLAPGDRISTIAHCTAVRDPDGKTQLIDAAQGIFLRARAYGELSVERPARVPLTLLPIYLTRQLKENIDVCFSSESAPLIKAVVTGDRSGCSNVLDSTIRRTGLSHTTAVSGMHLSYLVGFLLLILGKGKRSASVLTIPIILLVTVMAGCTPSIVRAAVMLILVQIAPLLGRESDGPTSLAAALLLLLVTDPYCVASVGLQLSFASMAGLMLFSEPIRDRILEWLRPEEKGWERLWNWPTRLLAGSLGATLSTMLFTTPLTACYFGQFTLVAPLANLLVLWAVSVLFCGGLLLGVLWSWLPALCALTAPVVDWTAGYMNTVVERLSRLPFASVPSGEPFYLLWVLFVYGLVLLAVLIPGRKRIRTALGVGLCTFALAVLLTNQSFYAGNMGVWVLDVGQGQSVLLRVENELVLVDCGGDASENAGDIAADVIQSLGRSHIDRLVVSHYHSDHANGVSRLLERLTVDTVFLPDVEPDSTLREQIVQAARKQGSQVCLVGEDMCLPFAGGQLNLYAPLGGEDVNELGLAVLCTQGERDVLLTGDMGTETELALLEHAQLPDVEVMVAGHHGSKYSNSTQLLEKVRPDIAVFSSGRYNTYGHPAPETMERFRAVGAQLYRTDHMGMVRITAGNDAE